MQGTEIVGITAGECENPVKVFIVLQILSLIAHHALLFCSKYLAQLKMYSGVFLFSIWDLVCA